MARRKAINAEAILTAYLRKLGARGGLASARKLSKAERIERAQAAAQARWKRAKGD